jgi:subtilase family serine protease
MATISIILRQEYKSQDGKYPVTFVIRNQGTHAYILSGVKIEKIFKTS